MKIRGKVPVNIEYENAKQEKELLIKERNDFTPLVGMNWMKKCKFTIKSTQVFTWPRITNQKRKNIRQFS